VWWCRSITPALGKLRQEDHELQASPGNIFISINQSEMNQRNKTHGFLQLKHNGNISKNYGD
jgi:hypothetical protein